MTQESGVGLRPSVTHIKRTGRAAAFRVPGMEEDQKGRRHPCETEDFYSILVSLGSLNFNLVSSSYERYEEALAGVGTAPPHPVPVRFN